ncbi:hypothetical protein JCM21900_006565 [Sporobolomyces salmonicolor]
MGEVARDLSPWTGVGSPASSDFEPIGDSDLEVVLNPSAPHASTSGAYLHPPIIPSNLSRSLSARRREPSYGSRAAAAAAGALRDMYDPADEEQDHGRGVEGDDEDSSAFEDAGEDARGRGRTRERRRDPELKRSMLEDALRSSLATLLSFAPGQAGMSQTPSMSYTSLTSLLSPSFPPTASSPGAAPVASSSSLPRLTRPTHRTSPFTSSLSDPFEEDDEEDDPVYGEASAASRTQHSRTSDEVLSTSSSGDERTQLGPHAGHPRAIPIPTSSHPLRTRQRSYSDSQHHVRGEPFFSPLQPSRPLGSTVPGLPSSGSPPVFSRRRGARRGRGGGRSRGRGGGSSSPGPGPASIEERRRARVMAAQSSGIDARGTTDVEDESVERDEAFAELVAAARFFSDLSPRGSPSVSFPGSHDATHTAHEGQWMSCPDLLDSSPTYSEEEDPALGSESVPTLGGLSSGAEGDRSRSPASQEGGEKTNSKEKTRVGGEKAGRARGGGDEKRERRGWFAWLGIGRTVELKVWHLVGLCGLLMGVGWGASTLIRSVALPSLPSFATFTRFAPPTRSTVAASSSTSPRMSLFL